MSNPDPTTSPNRPDVCVVVCTRNRADMIGAAIESLLTSDHNSFEVIVVDQSTNGQSGDVIAAIGADPRLLYQPTETVGLSIARNIGVNATTAPVVLMTDDDCTVPSTWISDMAEAFDLDPTVACVYCDVLPGPHDPKTGFIPHTTQDRDQRFDRIRDFDTGVGIGAGVGYRRDAVMAIGGFDPILGAGARFKAAEELDVSLRLLAAGYSVRYVTSTSVVHHGFRTNEEGRDLIRGYMYGTAACLVKSIRCGQLGVIFPFGRLLWNSIGRVILDDLKRRRVPRVMGRVEYILRGIAGGLVTPVEGATNRFKPT